MKRSRLITLFLMIWTLAIAASETKAQTAYGISIVCANDPTICGNVGTHTIDGYSGTWLDYYAGLYYDPDVIGDLYRTDIPETSLSTGHSIGYADLVPAEVYLSTSDYVEGKTYCTYSQHAVWSYYYYLANNWWFDPFQYDLIGNGDPPWPGAPFSNYWVIPRCHFLGWTQACITIPLPPTPTPTPPPPTPTPTPCDPGLQNSCQDEQILVEIGSPLKPLGTAGGSNKARVVACVYNGETPEPNRTVQLSLSGVIDSGGHIDSRHAGARPLGKLDKSSGTTGANGCFLTLYSTSHIAGVVEVEARSGDLSARKETFVGLVTLAQLFDGDNFRINPNPDTAHPSNNWGSAEANASYPRIADAYKTRFYGSNQMPENDKLRITDISLVLGGKYDLASSSHGIPIPNWHNLSAVHKYHREGNSVDMRCCVALPGFILPDRRAAFKDLALGNGATNFLIETNPDHYHLSFNGEANNFAQENDPVNTNTPSSFVENTWEAVFDRFSNQDEYSLWHDRLLDAKTQSQTALLDEAKVFKRTLFDSQEYLGRQRTESEFINDVYLAYLFREPDEKELEDQLAYLSTINATTERARRLAFLGNFEGEAEFETLVSQLVDGEVVEVPIPTPTPTPTP